MYFRNRFQAVIAGLLTVVLVLPGCDYWNRDIGKLSGREITKLLVISDSMGTGYNIATPFPDRITAALGVPLVNDSINGRQTSEVMSGITQILDQEKPSHLIVLLGTNDARKNDIDAAVRNLGSIADLARSRNIVVTIGTIPVYLADPVINENTRTISDHILAMKDVHIANIRTALGDGSETIGDLIHPNDAGQAIIAELFIAKL